MADYAHKPMVAIIQTFLGNVLKRVLVIVKRKNMTSFPISILGVIPITSL